MALDFLIQIVDFRCSACRLILTPKAFLLAFGAGTYDSHGVEGSLDLLLLLLEVLGAAIGRLLSLVLGIDDKVPSAYL